MSTGPNPPAQPEPAEGAREDEQAGREHREGVSATEPAEGGDDAPAGGSGSPG